MKPFRKYSAMGLVALGLSMSTSIGARGMLSTTDKENVDTLKANQKQTQQPTVLADKPYPFVTIEIDTASVHPCDKPMNTNGYFTNSYFIGYCTIRTLYKQEVP